MTDLDLFKTERDEIVRVLAAAGVPEEIREQMVFKTGYRLLEDKELLISWRCLRRSMTLMGQSIEGIDRALLRIIVQRYSLIELPV